jgi:tetratricopeptide (TPR) repeat protein
MRNPVKTTFHHFAWPVGASRLTASCLFVALALTANGCGRVGSSGNGPADGMDPASLSEVIEDARARQAADPAQPYWPFRSGEAYAAMDSTSQAIAALQDALAVDAAYVPAISLLSQLWYDAGNYTAAIALLDGYIATHADAPDALRAALALHLDAAGDNATAASVLSACTTNHGDVAATRAFVGLRGDAPAASLDDAKAALDGERTAANWNNYGVALLHAGNPVEARKAFESALALNETLPGAMYNLAIVENFYFFNESAGRQWFDRYARVANDDPDGLAAVFGIDMTRLSPGRASE